MKKLVSKVLSKVNATLEDNSLDNFRTLTAKFELFDFEYYASQMSEPPVDPMAHYFSEGAQAGLNPHPLFETNYYLQQSELARSGQLNPLLHFILIGAKTRISPHPLFDIGPYLDQCGIEDHPNAIAHFRREGCRAGLHPHALFDPKYYLAHGGLSDPTSKDPLSDYITSGWKQQRNPHPLFDTKYYCAQMDLAHPLTENPLVNYLHAGAAAGVSCHPLFDPRYYASQISALDSPTPVSIVHFLSEGWKEKLSPHPVFDSRYYLETNADVAASNINPILHFLASGHKERRHPHPLFDIAFYLSQGYADPNSTDPLSDYVTRGFKKGRDPHPIFNSDYYSAKADIKESVCPLAHYTTDGAEANLSCHPLFDITYYRQQLDEPIANKEGPIVHYLRTGAKKGLSPHLLFDPAFYKEENGEKLETADALVHYLTVGYKQNWKPHPLFDGAYFIDQVYTNKDFIDHVLNNKNVSIAGQNPLVAFVTTDFHVECSAHPLFDLPHYKKLFPELEEKKENALMHFLTTRFDQLQSPHPIFDIKFYLKQTPKLAENKENPLVHYAWKGWKKQLKPHPLFDPVFYVNSYFFNPYFSEVKRSKINPLVNYITTGFKQDRQPHPLFDGRFYTEQYEKKGFSLRDANPLSHYLTSGFSKVCNPHPLFDTRYYMEAHPELKSNDESPLVHYLECDWETLTAPHAAFDKNYYARQYPGLEFTDINPLVHYVLHAEDDCPDPHPLFDSAYLLAQCPGKPEAKRNPLAYFLRFFVDEEGNYLNPHPLFDTEFYAKRYSLELLTGQVAPLNHFLNYATKQDLDCHPLIDSKYIREQLKDNKETMPVVAMILEEDLTIDPHPLFSSTYYLKQLTRLGMSCTADDAGSEQGAETCSPAARRRTRKSAATPIRHYLSEGWQAGINPHPLFDIDFYLKQKGHGKRPDGEPLSHFVERGARELRNPHRLFDVAMYSAENPNVQALKMNPLVHYVRFGRPFSAQQKQKLGLEHRYASDGRSLPALMDYLMDPAREAVVHQLLSSSDDFEELKRRIQAASFVTWHFTDGDSDYRNTLQCIRSDLSTLAAQADAVHSSDVLWIEISSGGEHASIGVLDLCLLTSERQVNFAFSKQEILDLLGTSKSQAALVHNIFSNLRLIQDIIKKSSLKFSLFVGSSYNKRLAAQLEHHPRSISQALVDFQQGLVALDYEPATLLNWEVSQKWLYQHAQQVFAESEQLQIFLTDCYSGFNNCTVTALDQCCSTVSLIPREEIRTDKDVAQPIFMNVENPKRTLKLGIPIFGGSAWLGGLNYLDNLITAAQEHQTETAIEPYLLTVDRIEPGVLDALTRKCKAVISLSSFEKSEFDKLDLDCLFTTQMMDKDITIPIVSWLYDFQHKEMPVFFPPADLAARDELFGCITSRAARIIVSSLHAAENCRMQYPEAANKLRVVSFVPTFDESAFFQQTEYVREKYRLPEKFVYLPNQFWIHKNHETVIDALRLCLDKGKKVTVVCTGAMSDSRDESYFTLLQRKIASARLSDYMLLLGLVPRQDVIAFMREADTILQPSLYEGWSSSVEEARAFGKHAILSDIPVHREQALPDAHYFKPMDAAGLANLLMSVHDKAVSLAPKNKDSAKLLNEHKERFKRFGNVVVEVFGELVS